MFKTKTKSEKEILKLKKMKDEYDKLETKFMNGTIANNELEKYNQLSEEIKKMTEKFTIKNGKLVLNTPAKTEEVKVKNPEESIKQEQVVQQQQAIAQQEAQMRAQQEAQFRAQQEAQLRAQQEAQFRAQQEAQLRAQQEAEMRVEHEAQLRAEQVRQAQLLSQSGIEIPKPQMSPQEAQMMAQQQQEAQLRAQQEAQLRAQQESQMKEEQAEEMSVHVFMSDLPELKLLIRAGEKNAFASQIDKAIMEGDSKIFRFGPYNLVPSKIIMYSFS